jgi:hypothetical protein
VNEADFEKEVLPVSFGDSKSKSSAYLLIYLDPSMIKSGGAGSMIEDYVKLLQPGMVQEIYDKNEMLKKQVDLSVGETIVKNIIATKTRID